MSKYKCAPIYFGPSEMLMALELERVTDCTPKEALVKVLTDKQKRDEEAKREREEAEG